MSGETEANISGWTVDTLHSHIAQLFDERRVRYEDQIQALHKLINAIDERQTQRFKAIDDLFRSGEQRFEERFQSQKEAVAAALTAAERAVGKAETASEKRFDSVNEFRAALSDQTSRLMPRAESEARLQAMSEKLDVLIDRVNRSEGKGAGVAMSWAIATAVIGLIIGLVGVGLAVSR